MPKLSNYRLLGKSGLRISPLTLGTMTFGTDWGWGADKEEAKRIFDYYVDLGGNSIDTANKYTDGTSEKWLGEFVKERREEFVLATKFSINMRLNDPNAGGNHRKNIVQSLNASLKRLGTDYIDIYWLHAWEFRTPIEEVMRTLDDLVAQGKILYIAVSDAPAWKISEANTIARLRGWTEFIALQVRYNLVDRTSELDLIPMARELGLGVMPWSPLSGGLLSGKYTSDDIKDEVSGSVVGTRRQIIRQEGQLNERSLAIAEEVKRIACEADRTPSQVALNWLAAKPGVASPILGARTLDQIKDNLDALDLQLSQEQVARLEKCSSYPLAFPYDFYHTPVFRQVIDGQNMIEKGFEVY